MYQTRTNAFVNLLTILGLLVAVVSAIIAWLQLVG
jgi:hypothetical protein